MSSMHRFYINPDDIQGNMATMTGQDAKHLVQVLRLAPGNIVELADGDGTHYLSEIEDVTSNKVIFKIIDRTLLKAESPAHITIAQGMLKDKKMDVILRHLTELGIKEWMPFFASRSVPCPNSSNKTADLSIPKSKGNSSFSKLKVGLKTKDARVERWERIVRESIKQCGRSLLPVIHQPVSFNEMLNKAAYYDEKIVFWEKETTPIDLIRERGGIKEQNKVIVMIGPEGGFSDQEMETAKHQGFQSFSLGNRILRAETASIAACTLIQNIFGDLGKQR